MTKKALEEKLKGVELLLIGSVEREREMCNALEKYQRRIPGEHPVSYATRVATYAEDRARDLARLTADCERRLSDVRRELDRTKTALDTAMAERNQLRNHQPKIAHTLRALADMVYTY